MYKHDQMEYFIVQMNNISTAHGNVQMEQSEGNG